MKTDSYVISYTVQKVASEGTDDNYLHHLLPHLLPYNSLTAEVLNGNMGCYYPNLKSVTSSAERAGASTRVCEIKIWVVGLWNLLL